MTTALEASFLEQIWLNISDVISRSMSVLGSIRIVDIIDMLLLAYFIYKGIKLVRETKAKQLLIGIFIVIGIYLVSSAVELKAMTFLLENFLQVGILAIIIVFQPELRRILERVGSTNVKMFGENYKADSVAYNLTKMIDSVSLAASQLSETTTGALIVIERQTHLGDQIATGTVMDCLPSAATLGAIFYPKAPLHDGAVIIRNSRIIAAGCFLPTPQKEELINKQLGSRHRAAIGMSENSDAIVIVVSEETGTISVAENGELTRGFTKERLEAYLRTRLVPEKPQDKQPLWQRFFTRKEQKNG